MTQAISTRQKSKYRAIISDFVTLVKPCAAQCGGLEEDHVTLQIPSRGLSVQSVFGSFCFHIYSLLNSSGHKLLTGVLLFPTEVTGISDLCHLTSVRLDSSDIPCRCETTPHTDRVTYKRKWVKLMLRSKSYWAFNLQAHDKYSVAVSIFSVCIRVCSNPTLLAVSSPNVVHMHYRPLDFFFFHLLSQTYLSSNCVHWTVVPVPSPLVISNGNDLSPIFGCWHF